MYIDIYIDIYSDIYIDIYSDIFLSILFDFFCWGFPRGAPRGGSLGSQGVSPGIPGGRWGADGRPMGGLKDPWAWGPPARSGSVWPGPEGLATKIAHQTRPNLTGLDSGPDSRFQILNKNILDIKHT